MPYPSGGGGVGQPAGRTFNLASWRLKARYMLSHFGFFCSQFGKFIAPAYYHDRCERCVRRNIRARDFTLLPITHNGSVPVSREPDRACLALEPASALFAD